MSRTRKGSKGHGHEYWSRRPHSNSCGCLPGKLSKKLTHKAERQESKRETKPL